MSWWSCRKGSCCFQIPAPTRCADLLLQQAEPTCWQHERSGWNSVYVRAWWLQSAAESLWTRMIRYCSSRAHLGTWLHTSCWSLFCGQRAIFTISVSSTFTECYITITANQSCAGNNFLGCLVFPKSIHSSVASSDASLHTHIPFFPPQAVCMEDMHVKGGKNWPLREEVDIGFFLSDSGTKSSSQDLFWLGLSVKQMQSFMQQVKWHRETDVFLHAVFPYILHGIRAIRSEAD